MTVAIKVSPRTVVRTKVATRLVGQVIADDGIVVTESGGNFTVGLDLTGLEVVTGPGPVTDNMLARFDGATGRAIQGSPIIVSDAGIMTGGTWQGELIDLDYVEKGTAGYHLTGNGASASSYNGFLQAGTGAATRTWQAKAREIISATDFTGVDPTGVADSTIGLQAWIDYIYSNDLTGHLPAGSYKHSGLSRAGNGNGLRIIGDGHRATTLVNTSLTSSDITLDTTLGGMNNVYIAGISFNPSVFKTAGYAIEQIGDTGLVNSKFSDLEIGRNSSVSLSTWGGIAITSCLDITIQDVTVYVIGEDGRGLSLVGTAPGAFPHIGMVNGVKIHNYVVKDGYTGGVSGETTGIYVGDYAFGIDGVTVGVQGGPNRIDYGIWIATTSVDITVSNNIKFFGGGADTVARNPLRVDGGTDVAFIGGTFQNSGAGYDAVLITGGSLVAIQNNSINGGLRNGISITGGNQIKILDNTIYNNGFEGGGSNVYSDIKVANSVGTNAVSINGNTFGFTGTTPWAKYNIEIVGPTNNNYVIGLNNYGNNLSGNVFDGGVGASTEWTGENTFTRSSAEALAVRSGGASAFTYLGIGRTSVDVQYAVAGTTNHFFTGTAAGDAVVNASGSLWLGIAAAPKLKIASGGVTLGAAGTLVPLIFGNATSGTVTLQPVAGALGTVTLSLPAATDTLVGKATTDTLTNKTLTAAVLGGTTNVSGGQLQFPSSQSASANVNTLDDYEEGTWTPGVSFGGASVGVTYTTQSGTYTKIGNLVFCAMYLVLSSKGSSVGAALITGLPFAAAGPQFFATNSAYAANFNTITLPPTFHFVNGASTILPMTFALAGVQLTNAEFQNTTEFRSCFVYTTTT